MDCINVDRVRPLDELLDDQIREFDSGRDTVCDRDLDRMIWKLGDFDNEEPLQDAEEFLDEPPVEEELIEKRRIAGGRGRSSFSGGRSAEEAFFAGEHLATARAIGAEPGRTRNKAVRSTLSAKKKK